MANFLIQRAAGFRLDDIYRYTKDRWGKSQADRYINGLFERFQSIADQAAFSKPIPAILEVNGFVSRYENHYIYWKYLDDGNIGIVMVLHERMHQIERLKDDLIA